MPKKLIQIKEYSIKPKRHFDISHLAYLSMPRWARRVFMSGMTLVVIIVLGRMVYSNWDSLSITQWQFNIFPLFISFFIYLVFIGLAAYSWGHMLRHLGSETTYRDHISIYFIANLANRIPLPLGYVASRFFLYDQKTNKTIIAFGTVLEMVLLILAGFITSTATWPESVLFIHWSVKSLILLVGFAFVHPKILNRILKWIKVKIPQKLDFKETLFWLLLYLGVWTSGGTVLYLLILSIYPVQSDALILSIGVWSISGLVSMLMVILPVGLGVRELTISLLLISFLPAGVAAVIAIYTRIVLTIFEIIMGGIAWVILNSHRRSTGPTMESD